LSAGQIREKGTDLSRQIGFVREGRARTRVVRISTTEPPSPENGGAQPSASSAPSGDPPKPIPANGFAAAGLRTVGDAADGSRRANGSIVNADPLKINGETDADGADANRPPRSELENRPAWRARL